MDAADVARVRDLRANAADAHWNEWFAALFALSKPMISTGGAQVLASFIGSEPVARALRGAPPVVREKVDFLLLVGARDRDRIRMQGARLLAGPIHQTDPAFGAYVLVATATACLASAPDDSCRPVLAQLDRVRREGPVFDLLRAHRAARR